MSIIRILLASAALVPLSACITPIEPPSAATSAERAATSVFEPAPDGRSTNIDYAVIDEWLDAVVVYVGPSTRTKAPPARNPLQTRIKRGHHSDLRLEGNKVPYSLFTSRMKELSREYADGLVTIGNRLPLTKLPRNEQLAYWINLHNMLLFAELAERYPVREPQRLVIGENGERLHDAKIVTIQGVDLSLRDIRRNIVYRYWSDPRVFYGFWHGDLASPNLRTRAWTADNLNNNLDRNAREFVNALRGVDSNPENLLVSPLYEEIRGEYFSSWPADLKDHLLEFANQDVTDLIRSRETVAFLPYEDRIADLAGGEPYQPISFEFDSLDDNARTTDLPPGVRGMIRDIGEKFDSPTFRARFRQANVTIEDGASAEEENPEID